MSALRNMSGLRFGKLFVLGRASVGSGRVRWACQCDCGSQVVVQSNNLHSGNTISCGCTRSEAIRAVWRENRTNMRVPYQRLDLSGRRFGHLVGLHLVNAATPQSSRTIWRFRCDCGTEIDRDGWAVRSGKQRSCGCATGALISQNRARHGHARCGSKSPEYRSWISMRVRCSSPSHDAYRHYGGRGIRVCDSWLTNFPTFFADMGPKPTPKHSIDRIDPDGNYEPGNCRWATASQQQQNRRKRTAA